MVVFSCGLLNVVRMRRVTRQGRTAKLLITAFKAVLIFNFLCLSYGFNIDFSYTSVERICVFIKLPKIFILYESHHNSCKNFEESVKRYFNLCLAKLFS